ncbi:TRAP transporter substrate-binding protein [uncultured Tateyamaria sp.]|nr:TRAP transporter substrate-binding protein [uncultured Tateyamaria sp.]
MPTPYSDTNFHTENIRAFAAEVERLTDGELVIEVHPGGTLVAHAEIADAVQNGDVQIGEVFQSTLSSRSPLFGADGLPFLATSYADAQRLSDAEFDILTRILAEDGLTPLYSVPWPPQGLYSKQEIIDPIDLNGAAFRVNNDILNGFAAELGASPTRLEVSEIPDAFRSGAIDAMMTSATTGVSTQSWEYLDYYYDLQAWLPKNIVFVNSDALAALSEENRQAVFTAAQNASDNGWLLSQINAVEAIKALFDNGMTILTPGQDLADSGEGGAMRQVSPALLTELERASQAIRESWLQTAGSDGQQLIEAFEEGQE